MFIVFLSFFLIWLCQVLAAACGIFSCSMWALSCALWHLVPWPGIKARPSASGAWRLSHWTTREFHYCFSMNGKIQNLSRGKTVHLIFGVWSNHRSWISFSSIKAKHRTSRKKKVSSPSHPFGLDVEKKKKLFSFVLYFQAIFSKTWNLLVYSNPKQQWKVKFHFTTWFFQRLSFLLNRRSCIYKFIFTNTNLVT